MTAAEQKKSYQVVKQFKGLNTKANRTSIEETEFSWLENTMPVGFANMRVVPNYTIATTSGNTAVVFSNNVTHESTVNIGLNDYVVVFEENGAAQFFNLTTKTLGNIAPASTFSASGVQTSQWKNERMLIIDPDEGYFTWDGTDLIFIGSIGFILITAPGGGYTTAPNVLISAPDQANGVQATAVATISSGAGSVIAVNVNAAGDGYVQLPVVTLGAPNLIGGTQATASATLSNTKVVAITIINGGDGYTTNPSVTIQAPPSGNTATANAIIDTGQVTSIFLTEAGTGYTNAANITVTISGGGGTGANALAQLNTFETGTVNLVIANGGEGYSNSSPITISGPGGGGTTATAQVVVIGGIITGVVMTNPGSGYTSIPTVTVGGSGNNAVINAIVNLNQNVDVQSFSGRVWIAAGRTEFWTAADTYNDFTSVSAGSLTLTDSTLHGNITKNLSANSFLYIFGDDSINVFSDVRVTSAGITIFTNTNISASIGSNLQDTIFPYFRSVLFMNRYGMYALIGSTTSKISDALDGILQYIDFTSPISAGQVLINNILCAAFTFRYVNPLLNIDRHIQAVFFEKKWFLTSQNDALQRIASVPFDGSVNVYGIDTVNLYKLYADTQVPINWTIKTALWPLTDPIRTKQGIRWGVEATFISGGGVIYITIDNENASSVTYDSLNSITWVNNTGAAVQWLNNSSQVVAWTANGYQLFWGDAQQYGKYLGMTVTSATPNVVTSGFDLEYELRARF